MGDTSDGSDLAEALAAVAGAASLLVASDYDGTLAPLVDDPQAAWPSPGAVEVLGELAALAGTDVAVVSGRPIRDLLALARFDPAAVHLVGSHGAEHVERGAEVPERPVLEAGAAARLAEVEAALAAVVARHPGARLERKPFSAALHVRGLPGPVGAAALAEALAVPGAVAGVAVRQGKDVVELMAVHHDKGEALLRLRAALGAGVVVFIGDDLTDEDGFSALGPGDLAVKVGPGPTVARHRIADPEAVVQLLAALSAARSAALRRMTPGSGRPA